MAGVGDGDPIQQAFFDCFVQGAKFMFYKQNGRRMKLEEVTALEREVEHLIPPWLEKARPTFVKNVRAYAAWDPAWLRDLLVPAEERDHFAELERAAGTEG